MGNIHQNDSARLWSPAWSNALPCRRARAHPLKPRCHWNRHFQYSIVLAAAVVVVVSHYFLSRGFSVTLVFFLANTQDWFFPIAQFLLDSRRVRIVRLFSQHQIVCLFAGVTLTSPCVVYAVSARIETTASTHLCRFKVCRNRASQCQRLIGRRLAVVCCKFQKTKRKLAGCICCCRCSHWRRCRFAVTFLFCSRRRLSFASSNALLRVVTYYCIVICFDAFRVFFVIFFHLRLMRWHAMC